MSDLFDTLDSADFEDLAFALKDYSKSLRHVSYNTKLELDEQMAAKEAADAADTLANQLFELHLLLVK